MPFKAVYSLAYTILITSVTCYLCLSWANYHSSPTLVTAFWPVQVVVTMVAAYYITGDVLHSVQYIGVFLIVAGLFGVVYATHKVRLICAVHIFISHNLLCV
jgi:drug/metabolite transporter (DMT)-like permease